jgi:hypothetical protein
MPATWEDMGDESNVLEQEKQRVRTREQEKQRVRAREAASWNKRSTLNPQPMSHTSW